MNISKPIRFFGNLCAEACHPFSFWNSRHSWNQKTVQYSLRAATVLGTLATLCACLTQTKSWSPQLARFACNGAIIAGIGAAVVPCVALVAARYWDIKKAAQYWGGESVKCFKESGKSLANTMGSVCQTVINVSGDILHIFHELWEIDTKNRIMFTLLEGFFVAIGGTYLVTQDVLSGAFQATVEGVRCVAAAALGLVSLGVVVPVMGAKAALDGIKPLMIKPLQTAYKRLR